MIGGKLATLVLGAALALVACAGPESSPPTTVTVTATTTATATASASPSSDPTEDPTEAAAAEVEAAVSEACRIVADSEPSYDRMQQAGPWGGQDERLDLSTMDLPYLETMSTTMSDTYARALEALSPSDLLPFASPDYRSVLSAISYRKDQVDMLADVVPRFAEGDMTYERGLMYRYAAYTAAIEMGIDGCPPS